MGKRRLQRPVPVAGRRRQVRPRYGRISAAGASLAITLVTLLGGLGVLPEQAPAAAAADGSSDAAWTAADRVPATPTPSPSSAATAPRSTDAAGSRRTGGPRAVPEGSGTGKRVVFDISDQRVWLVEADGTLDRTYLVSGSVTDNLRPGSYAVYSRSRWAVGVDGSGVMQYFARFTRGENAPIGFHSIPTLHGRALQTLDQLGTPQSHGCIRQALADAQELWAFAPVGTNVVVTA